MQMISLISCASQISILWVTWLYRADFNVELEQRNAWSTQICLLKEALHGLIRSGRVYFEYVIPRLGKRIDCVLIIDQRFSLLKEPESAISPDQDSLVLVATAFFQNGSVRQALHDPFGVATTADGCRIVPFLGAVGCLGHSAVSALAADSVEPHRVGWR